MQVKKNCSTALGGDSFPYTLDRMEYKPLATEPHPRADVKLNVVMVRSDCEKREIFIDERRILRRTLPNSSDSETGVVDGYLSLRRNGSLPWLHAWSETLTSGRRRACLLYAF